MNVEKFFIDNQQLILFDTEFTSWEGAQERNWSGENEHREIFQMSATKLNLLTGEILGQFERFVCPQINPELSEYVQALTGISQEAVDTKGVAFADMYADFLSFGEGLLLCAYGGGLDPEADGEVLKENIDLYGLDMQYDKERFFNIARVFAAAGIDTTAYTSGSLHTHFNVPVPGDVHNANHDVASLVASLLALKDTVTYTL